MSGPEQLSPSYEELSGLVAGLVARVEALEVENAELKRRLGMNSSNSSTPPSKDPIAAKAQRQAQRSSRERRADRKPGGQKGRNGSGLTPAPVPDRTELLDPPAECSGCGADLADGADAGVSWAQVWDIPPIVMKKVHYLLPVRREALDFSNGGERPSSLDCHSSPVKLRAA